MPSLCGRWLIASILVFHLCQMAIASHGSAPLQLDLALSPRTSRPAARYLRRRDGAPVTVPAVYDTHFVDVTVNATIGTPPQHIEFILATNSADTVVLAANDSACASHACGNAVFEASQSSTYQFLKSNFNPAYIDGTGGSGCYATEDFNLAGTSVPNMQFGLLLNGSLRQATLGVGYIPLKDAANSSANLPYRLYNQKSISVNAFSIWFEDENSTSGKLSFGGIDTGKFNGSLETFTVSPTDLSYKYATIPMSGVSGTVNGTVAKFNGSSANVTLDTSATSLFLPNNTITQIAHFLGATTSPSLNSIYVLAYSAMENTSTIDITLGSTVIHIPLEYLTTPWNATHAMVWINPTDDTFGLGVPFMRNAYTVFDYTHDQLSLAPLLKSDQSNVTSIPPNGVAGLKSTFNTNTTSSGHDLASGVTGLKGTFKTSPASSRHGLASSVKLGIGLGLGLCLPLLLLVIAAVVLLRRRNLRLTQTTQKLHTPTTKQHKYLGSISMGSIFRVLKTKFRIVNNRWYPI